MDHLDKVDFSEKAKSAVLEFLEANKQLVEDVLKAETPLDAYQLHDKYLPSAYDFFATKGVPRGEGRRALIHELQMRWSNRDSRDKRTLQ